MSPFASNIFAESFTTNLLPVYGEITLYAMKAFGGYDLVEAAYFAIMGAICACIMWYGAGRLLRHAVLRKGGVVPGDRAIQKNGRTRCAICFVGLFAAWPIIGFLLMPLLGIWRANAWMVIPLAAISHAVGYQMLVG